MRSLAALALALVTAACSGGESMRPVSLRLLDATHRALVTQMAHSPQLQISPENAAYLRAMNAALGELSAGGTGAASAPLASAAASAPALPGGPPPAEDRLVPAEHHLDELPMWHAYRRALESLATQPETEAALSEPLQLLLAHFEG